jgi:hypothetical protein
MDRIWDYGLLSRSLSSGAHSRDPLARNDDLKVSYIRGYAVPGGGRKWILYSAAIATTSSGFCSFML